MLRRYVSNWLPLLITYLLTSNTTTARFKDGYTTKVSKSDFKEFYGYLYSCYLTEKGFKINRETNSVTTPQGMTIELPHLLFLFWIDEAYMMHIYGNQDLTGRIVIDAGASVGDTAIYFLTRGAQHVYGFEIDPKHYAMAQSNIKRNNLQDKITIFNEGASAQHINELIRGQTNVFVKLDCEGCEYEVLPKLDLENVTDVVMEYHKEPQPLLSTLHRSGFHIKKHDGIIINATATDTIRASDNKQ
jgi:SAM-dependent methyltransferase